MIKYTSTPIKVSGFFLLISIFFSCTKDSDLLSDYVLQDSIGEIEQTNADESEIPEDPASDQNDNPSDPSTDRTIEVDFYVTTSGSASNDGLTEASAWNITHAFATAKAGDIVAIKAGNYGGVKLSTSRAGTVQNPIKFIGYTTTPGDITATSGPTYTYANWISNGSDLPDNVMPHLELNTLNPATSDKAFNITHEYIELHNFMVSEYEVGYDIDASNVTLNNCIGDQFGNWTPGITGWNVAGFGGSGEISTGYAIVASNVNYVTVENCLMIDAGLVSYFFINGGNHTVRNNWGVAENTGNGSDYIFDFYGADNCTITNNTAKKTYFGSLGHPSRCMIFQAQADNNTVDGMTSIGVKFQIENSDENEINDLTMTSSGGSGDQMGAVQIFGQSDDNIFKNLSIDGGGGIQFLGYAAGTGENPELPHTSAGVDNTFINVNLSNLDDSGGNALVSFHRLGPDGITGGTNRIIGLTADNFAWIINANRAGIITFEDSTFSNGRETSIDTFYAGWDDATGSYTANFINCNFSNNNFSNPPGN